MKRGHAAVLALTLALAGCGGSGDEGDGGGTTAGEASASSTPSSGKGSAAPPSPPSQSEATRRFRTCLDKQGVELPSPRPTSTPAERDTKKIMLALRKCMKAVSASPTPG